MLVLRKHFHEAAAVEAGICRQINGAHQHKRQIAKAADQRVTKAGGAREHAAPAAAARQRLLKREISVKNADFLANGVNCLRQFLEHV